MNNTRRRIEKAIRASFELDSLYYYLTFFLIAGIYIAFPLNIHTWESYWYAAGIEDLFNVRLIYDFFVGPGDPRLNYNIYHPSHPLLHVLSYLIYRLLGFTGLEVRALSIVVFINLSLGLFNILLIYKIIYFFIKDHMESGLLTLLYAFTDICWYYALSGEVYIAPSTMIMLTFYLLLATGEALENNKPVDRLIIAVGTAFSLAMAFHLIAVPFGVVILYLLYRFNQTYKTFDLKKALLRFGGITLSAVCLFYVLLPLMLMNIRSVGSYFEVSIVPNPVWWAIFGFHLKGSVWAFVKEFSWHSVMKMNSLLNSLIRTNHIMVIIYKFLLSAGFISTLVAYIKSQKRDYMTTGLLLWFFAFLVPVTALYFVEADDYWMNLVLPLFLLIALFLKGFLSRKALSLVLLPMVILNFHINLTDDIFPKSRAGETDFCLLAHLKEEIKGFDSFIFVYDRDNENFFDEVWYVNYILKKRNVVILPDTFRLTRGKKDRDYSALLSELFYLSDADPPVKTVAVISRPEQRQDEFGRYLIQQGFHKTERYIKKVEDTRYEKLASYPFGYVPTTHFTNQLLVQFYTLEPW